MDTIELMDKTNEIAQDIKEGNVRGWFGLPDDVEVEDGCDHTVAIILDVINTNVEDNHIINKKVKASTYPVSDYHQVYNDEKFDFCPKCGEKIDWEELENQIEIDLIKANDLYDECPDCGDPISNSVQLGEACANCEHVFNDIVPDAHECSGST